MNLTDKQKDLFRLLVSMHQSSGGQPFIFVPMMGEAGRCICGDSVPVSNDDLDFQQLQAENLITLTRNPQGHLCGRPTQLGITATLEKLALEDEHRRGTTPAAQVKNKRQTGDRPGGNPLQGVTDEEATPNRAADDSGTPKAGDSSSQDVPTVADIEAALNHGERKKAVRQRCRLDECSVTELWTDAFRQRGGKNSTKRTAFNRWQASRRDAPSWVDALIRARLLK